MASLVTGSYERFLFGYSIGGAGDNSSQVWQASVSS
jgi:hypothetical protein